VFLRRKFAPLLTRLTKSCVKFLGQDWLESLEHELRLSQGKGWGASTHVAEVAAVLSLLGEDGAGSVEVIAVDAGANVGEWTAALLESAPNARVYAFEPSKDAFGQLSARFARDSRVEPVNIAVGAEPRRAKLFADKSGSGLASLTRRRLDHFEIPFGPVEDVEVVRLDDWANKMSLQPNVLKLDIEGHELEALHGATKIFAGINVIQFEFGGCNIDTRTFFQDFFYFFASNGFLLFRLGPRGLVRISKYREIDEAFTTTNYFAKRV